MREFVEHVPYRVGVEVGLYGCVSSLWSQERTVPNEMVWVSHRVSAFAGM